MAFGRNKDKQGPEEESATPGQSPEEAKAAGDAKGGSEGADAAASGSAEDKPVESGVTGGAAAVGTGEPEVPEEPPTLAELAARTDNLERKLATRTFAGAALAVLALAAGIVAVVLAVDARDNSAGKDDLAMLEDRVSLIAEQAGVAEDAQQDVDSLSDRVSDLESQLSSITSDSDAEENRISVVEDDIEDLRQQISDIESSSSSGSGGGGSIGGVGDSGSDGPGNGGG